MRAYNFLQFVCSHLFYIFRNYSVGTIPRGVFCEQSSQKTRELQREIMQSMISVHRGACNCEGTEPMSLS